MVTFTARDRLKLLTGAGAFALSACGGGGGGGGDAAPMPVTVTPPVPVEPAPPVGGTPPPAGAATLKDTFATNFKMGSALNNVQIQNNDLSAQIAAAQFNSITPEYELKANNIAASEGVYDFTAADRVVDWAIANGMDVRGHALVWHEATPDYFLQGTRAQIRTRLEDYVTAVVDHFKDRIKVWDVVNEVVSVDIYNGASGIGPDRDTAWLRAVGNADYIDWAFRAARAADPDAVLFLNDYNTENPIKRAWLVEIASRLIDRGVPIDGVGHQFHFQPNTDISQAQAAIDAVDNMFAGLIQHVTELDLNMYQDPGTCWEREFNCDADLGENPPAVNLAAQARMVRDLFDVLMLRASVESVTVWGVRDSDSWLNDVPTERFNHPLLFDRSGAGKPAFLALTDPNYEI